MTAEGLLFTKECSLSLQEPEYGGSACRVIRTQAGHGVMIALILHMQKWRIEEWVMNKVSRAGFDAGVFFRGHT